MPNINDPVIHELERQLERSGFYTHSAISNQAQRINEIESFLYGLIDSLIQKKLIDKSKFEDQVKAVREETLKAGEHSHAGIAITADTDEGPDDDFIPVDCEQRIPVCKAVCCKLNFALTVNEIELGKAKWDLGEPYFIRQNENGFCSQFDTDNRCCSIYEDRPKVCRKYSCANDGRIWKDFEKMELNHEWLGENFRQRKVQLREVYMIPETKVEYRSKT